ncbi:mannosyltransferase [Oleoguttula sp. CCFEE 5521]
MPSHYTWLLFALTWQSLAHALAVPSGQDRNERVKPPHHRVRPQTVQLVSPNQNVPGKYFHEASFSGHYDGRFASGKLPYDARREHLTALTHTYFKTMNDVGIETWLMHGSLLGWYWNRNALPWDSDIDVMVSERSIDHLANYYNMSMHHYAEPGRDGGRDYLLEINPHYHIDSPSDTTNVIDARWICTQTGLFIDITTLRQNRSAQEQGVDGAMMVKDNHHYMYDDIFPLRETTFEGVITRVPFAYADLLVEEYGPAALSKTTHENHRWDTEKQEWTPLRLVQHLRPSDHVREIPSNRDAFERLDDRIHRPTED